MNTEPTPELPSKSNAMALFFRKQAQRVATLRMLSQAARDIAASADSPVKVDPLTRYQEIFEREFSAAMISHEGVLDMSAFHRQWFFKELEKRQITDLTWSLLVLRLLEQDASQGV